MCIGFDLDNPRRNADCGVRLGEGKVPFPRVCRLFRHAHRVFISEREEESDRKRKDE